MTDLHKFNIILENFLAIDMFYHHQSLYSAEEQQVWWIWKSDYPDNDVFDITKRLL